MQFQRARVPVRLLLAPACVVAAAGLAGCSGNDKSTDGDDDPTARPTQVAMRVQPGKVVGKVRPETRKTSVRQVGAVVDDYVESAYLKGPFPRTSYEKSFAHFTPGAADRARAQSDLTTSRVLGKDAEGIEVRRREVTVDLMGVQGSAPAATARLRLAYAATGGAGEADESGEKAAQRTVQGRLLLFRDTQGRWKIFGFDLKGGR